MKFLEEKLEGMSVAERKEMAAHLRVSIRTVDYWRQGEKKPRPEQVGAVINYLKLETQEIVDFLYEYGHLPKAHVPKIQPKPIPVISWISAGKFAEPIDSWPVGVSAEGDPVTIRKKVSSNAFALIVQGDSMETRYKNGDMIIVDPALRCEKGEPCVAWCNGGITFKIFDETKKEIKLKPLNNKYEELVVNKKNGNDFRIIGKVVDMVPKL